MRFDLWSLIRFLHVTGAILWVGGQLTLTLVVRPVTTRLMDEESRVRLVSELGSRFGRITALMLIPLLLASGLALTYHRGVTFGGFGVSGYGTTLAVKIALALLSFGLAIAHGMTAVRSSSRAVRTVGVAGVVVSLAVVALAASLVP
ncbi:MAG: hypothetical protein ACLFWM_13905 [Actinomycetota bacterium]